MMRRVFSQDQLDTLCARVRKILAEIGYRVEHEGLSELLRQKGLGQSTAGRFLFDDQIINDFAAHQTQYVAAQKSSAAAPPERPAFGVSLGNIAPKFYDYAAGLPQLATTEHLERLCKYAHQKAEIDRIMTPLSITDEPPRIAPIASFLTMAKLTGKYGYYLEPLFPEVVKYLAELSVIFLGEGQENAFMDPCNCINPILHLKERTAGVMMERAKYNVSSMITSMPTAGGNAPVTLDGAAIQGAAEIVGGLIISWLLNPNVNNKGYISSSVIDFRQANTTQSSPETVLIDCGVVELMEHGFGGNTGIGGKSYVAAKRPGLQAVYEKMFKAMAYQKYSGILEYSGGGVLDNGSLLSPEQFILDMEIQQSLHYLHPIETTDEQAVDAIAQVIEAGDGDFLSTDHTLAHFRNMWDPILFLRKDGRSEKEILDQAHARYQEAIGSYAGYEYDQTKIKAGEKVLARARKEFV